MTIVVDYNIFLNKFPYFKKVNNGNPATTDEVSEAYSGANIYISTTENSIGLEDSLQIKGVYLATAHLLYLMYNPDCKGIVNSAEQGSESASFQKRVIKNHIEYELSLTSYGRQLLTILETVQPLMKTQRARILPYYNSINTINNI